MALFRLGLHCAQCSTYACIADDEQSIYKDDLWKMIINMCLYCGRLATIHACVVKDVQQNMIQLQVEQLSCVLYITQCSSPFSLAKNMTAQVP